ncbi:MAG: hypothetical protein LBG49_00010 [Mycoplasmataceae bacterium]|nr:hypothetical protein [Mycoplasmataceae bacterium]
MAKEFNPHSQLERYTGKNFIVWVRRNIIAVILPALLLGCQRFFYVLARLISHKVFHSPSDFIIVALPWERAIKLTNFTSLFIIPYYLSYLYWIVMPFVVWATMGKRVFYNMCAAILVVELFSFIVWCFLPTRQDPEIYHQAWNQIFGSTTSTTVASSHTGFWKFTYTLCGQVYGGDLPDNLNPSGHNFLTFIIFCAFAKPNDKHKMRWGLFSFSLAYYLLVATSTILVRQHALIDVIFATSLGLAGFHFQKLTKFGHGMQAINEGVNNTIHNCRVEFKKSPKIAITYIATTILFSAFIGFEIYFAFISLFTGDPFKHLWDKQWNYLDYFH